MYPSDDQPEFAPFIRNIEIALTQSGAEVSKIVIAGKGRSAFEKIKKYSRFYYQIMTERLIRYDIIHLSYPSHTYLPLLFKRLGSSKLVVRLHGEDLVDSGILFETAFLKWGRRLFTLPSLKRASLVVVPSGYFRDEVNKKKINTRVHVYPSGGVDTDLLYPIDQPHDQFTIGFVGRLGDGKGIEYLLEATRNLTFPHKLLIVGNGPLKASLMEAAQQFCLKNVEFAGAVPHDALVAYYNQMDVFAFPTLMESFGNVAVEAMACGVPVIGSEIPALKEHIQEGVNGFLFDAGNAQMLAQKLSDFYFMSENEKNTMKKNACRTAKKYNRNTLTAQFVETLFSLVKDTPEK